MAKLLRIILLAAMAAGAARVAAAQTPSPAPMLQLSFDQAGNVSLMARNVTVREILAEWARQCGCYVVNADRLQGGPLLVPIQFDHQPQGKVLETLLRQAAGYALTPQRANSTSISNFETIYILATSAASASAFSPVPSTPVMSMPTPGSPDDEIPPVVPQGPPSSLRPDIPQNTTPAGMPMPSPSSAVPTPRIAGTPGTFVPLVPVGTPQSSAPLPGTMAPAPPPTALPPGR